jgi:hypothetical protein
MKDGIEAAEKDLLRLVAIARHVNDKADKLRKDAAVVIEALSIVLEGITEDALSIYDWAWVEELQVAMQETDDELVRLACLLTIYDWQGKPGVDVDPEKALREIRELLAGKDEPKLPEPKYKTGDVVVWKKEVPLTERTVQIMGVPKWSESGYIYEIGWDMKVGPVTKAVKEHAWEDELNPLTSRSGQEFLRQNPTAVAEKP